MAETAFPFPVDPVLTGVVIAFSNEEYVADKIFPRLEPRLTKRDFKYSLFAFAQSITLPDTRVGRKGTPNEVEFASTEKTASVEDYALDDLVPNDDIRNAPSNYDVKAHAAMGTMDLVLLAREARCADMAFNPDNYGAANKVTLSGSSQFSHPDSRPINLIQDASDTMIMKPNKLLLGRGGWTRMRRNPSMISATSASGTENGLLTLRAAADLLELDEIIVGSAWANASRRGQAPTMTRLFGNNALLFRQDKMATSMPEGRPTFGFTAQYLDRFSREIDEPKVGAHGAKRIRAGESVKEVIGAPDLGYLFQNVVAPN